MIRRAAVLAAVVAVVALLATPTARTAGPVPVAQTGAEYVVAGTIRCTATGDWVALDDAGHTPLGGLTVLAATDTHIQVGYDTAAEIHALVVTPDEYLAQQRVTVGASAGLSYAYVYMYDDSGLRDPVPCGSTSGNLWVYGRMTGPGCSCTPP